MFDLQYLFEDKTGYPLPASQYSLKIASGDDYLLGQLLRPHGGQDERHPLVLLCHGFPGNEQLRDLAAALRNAGALTVSVDSLLFLLLGDAKNPAFKTISRLVR